MDRIKLFTSSGDNLTAFETTVNTWIEEQSERINVIKVTTSNYGASYRYILMTIHYQLVDEL